MLLLAFGLVFLTTVVVGYLMHWLIPSLPLAAAFALGAVISPTDAVSVSAITSRLKVPSRVTTIIRGESLINDASGLVAFKFAVAAAVTGAFSWSDATVQFFLQSGGGFALGLAVAWLIGHLRGALTRFCVDDPLILTVLSLLTPYAAYLAADAAQVGSILAVVGAALYAGAHDGESYRRTDARAFLGSLAHAAVRLQWPGFSDSGRRAALGRRRTCPAPRRSISRATC